MELTIIAAYSKDNRVISCNGEIPWFSDDEIRKADLRHFRLLTLGKPVIMGRVTAESIIARLRGPLEGRTNIVVSGRLNLRDITSLIVVPGIFEALEEAKKHGGKAYVIGGERIYTQAILLPHTGILEITEIKEHFEGDRYFPAIDTDQWVEVARLSHQKYDFVSYKRKSKAFPISLVSALVVE